MKALMWIDIYLTKSTSRREQIARIVQVLRVHVNAMNNDKGSMKWKNHRPSSAPTNSIKAPTTRLLIIVETFHPNEWLYE